MSDIQQPKAGNHRTFIDYVREFLPGVSYEEADRILWNETPFPLVQGTEDLRPYLEKARARREATARQLQPPYTQQREE